MWVMPEYCVQMCWLHCRGLIGRGEFADGAYAKSSAKPYARAEPQNILMLAIPFAFAAEYLKWCAGTGPRPVNKP